MQESVIAGHDDALSAPDLKKQRVARDLLTLVLGSILAAVFSVVMVFVIPRITTVEEFGYWRLFILYIGYAGFFHLGLGEGALLVWAGKPLSTFSETLRPSIKFLIFLHLAFLAIACVIAKVALASNAKFVAVAVVAFALVQNISVLLQCALQASRQFAPVAVATAAPTGLFLLFVGLYVLKHSPNYRVLVICYFVGWLIVLAFLWAEVRPTNTSRSAWSLGKQYIAIGWPITLANTAFGLLQSSDRFVLSSAVPIKEFAQYSLAASTMMVPVTLIAAMARVFLPNLAAIGRERHPEIYAAVVRLIVLVWSVSLPYYFIVDWFVHHFLQAYIPVLPVARTLLLGIVFLAFIQILHSSVFNLYGKQRHFLVYSILAVAVSLGFATMAIHLFHSLLLVATMQVVAIGLWWFLNAWRLRSLTGESWRDFFHVVFIFSCSAICLVLSFRWSVNAVLRTLSYWLLMAAPLAAASGDQIRLVIRIIRDFRQSIASPVTTLGSVAD